MEHIVNNSPVALTVRRGNFILKTGENADWDGVFSDRIVLLGGIYVFGFIGM